MLPHLVPKKPAQLGSRPGIPCRSERLGTTLKSSASEFGSDMGRCSSRGTPAHATTSQRCCSASPATCWLRTWPLSCRPLLAAEEHGGAGLDAFVVERVDTMLVLRDYPEGRQPTRSRRRNDTNDDPANRCGTRGGSGSRRSARPCAWHHTASLPNRRRSRGQAHRGRYVSE